MEKRDKAWYVEDRAELLARLFLEDLGAAVFTALDDKNSPFNALAIFLADGKKSRIVAVKLQPTEQPVAEEFRFAIDLKSLHALQQANVPVLFLVVEAQSPGCWLGA